MRLIQFLDAQGQARVGRVDASGRTVSVTGAGSATYQLAQQALKRGVTLEALIGSAETRGEESYATLLESGRLLPPLVHPDPAHCYVSGTGLTHLGSAATRDAMHVQATPK